MAFQIFEFRSQPAVRLSLPGGARCIVALHGAQLLSWVTADGVERLYLSPAARFDGRSAIRGGVPICWPQFNQRGALAKHGFARNMAWHVASGETGTGEPATAHASTGESQAKRVVLSLHDSEATRIVWPHKFSLRLTVTLEPEALRIALDVHNIDSMPWIFSTALHTYLRVDDIAQARLEGLQGATRWDALQDKQQVEMDDARHFDAEFDSVYAAPAQALRLAQPSGTLQISQSASCSETIVWNPGAALSASLADLPEDGYRHMLCVEAGRIDHQVTLAAGAKWQAWQQLRVA